MFSRGVASRGFLYALFVLSGIAGLIYESIWSHYLKLFLGHAAYAQTLVLTIFMGGMAIGAWLAGNIARRAAHPLLWYAGAEALLGVAGFGFDPMFRGVQAWIFDAVIPQLGSPLAIDLAKWSVSGLIILPQSILLGATFPLMSAGIVRRYPNMPGSVLSWLYFTNSIGASAGVLFSGFVLIAAVGLPGTLMTAGLINFMLALSVYLMVRSGNAAAPPSETVSKSTAVPRLVLIAAFLTGAASFFYEIGWIRMLSLVLGAATHSFELMLSAFIFGLAAGAFWIRNRIDRQQEPLRMLGWIQICMAVCALLTMTLYLGSFEAMAAMRDVLARSDFGYSIFTLFSSSVCFVLMFPATFCAGMTLPMMTAILLRAGHGEASIGRVYAANTIGAIAGILLAIHVVMPLLGLRQVVIAGAIVDFALGAWLLRGSIAKWLPAQRLGLAFAGGIGLMVIATVRFDPSITASGPYRVARARMPGEIIFHADGKTATVNVSHVRDVMSISTNGKVDAAINLGRQATLDEYTMTLLALLPISMLPHATTAALIGMGSGKSTHTLLYDPRLEMVDTIEIEQAMAEGARRFGKATNRTFDDPRSHIWLEDAKTHFARNRRRYDIIISEPSNPWVSGVSSLFSKEFYQQIGQYLTEDGLYVQWLHLYEISPELVATVLNALGENFSDYSIYAANEADILIVSSRHGQLPPLNDWLFSDPAFRPAVERLGMKTLTDLELRKIGSKWTLAPLFRQLHQRSNSDYFPLLDTGALRERFKSSSARALIEIHPYSLRLENRADSLVPEATRPEVTEGMTLPMLPLRAKAMAEYFLGGELRVDLADPGGMAQIASMRVIEGPCTHIAQDQVLTLALKFFAIEAAPYLPAKVGARVVDKIRQSACAAQLSNAALDWVLMIEAITRQQPQGVRNAAVRMLGSPQDRAAAQFILAQLLLADLELGEAKAAIEHYRQFEGIPRSLAITYLASYALATHQSGGRN